MQGFVICCDDGDFVHARGWTHDVVEALRFARERDAQAYIDEGNAPYHPRYTIRPIEQCHPASVSSQVLDYNPMDYEWLDVRTHDKPYLWARGELK